LSFTETNMQNFDSVSIKRYITVTGVKEDIVNLHDLM
uniref:Transcriptional regulator n=1 Tax=Brugia timori TaxID=42155 RepID=A0A0R3QG59_9BILA